MLLANLTTRIRARGLPFLVVGVLNTVFGYGLTVGLYYLLTPGWPLVPIAVLANVICITLSFAMYKVFIFKGSGAWLPEYLRCYVVYGGNAVFGIAGLWLLTDVFGVPVWLAQGLVMGLCLVSSFFGHELFTFKAKLEPANQPGS